MNKFGRMSINANPARDKLVVMTKKKLDRRVQRTRKLLNDALMSLIQEKGYDNVTIEDITERANLGRTTFYLHYQGKDDLLLDHHDAFVAEIKLGSATREQLLGTEPQPAMIEFLTLIQQGREIYQAFRYARDAELIMRNVTVRSMQNLAASLEAAFPALTPNPPVGVFTRYIVHSEFGLIDWWLKSRGSESPQELAAMLQKIRAAIVRDAYGV